MKISKHKNVSELVKEFSAIFPLLKIKFYRKAHEPYAGSAASDEIVEEVTLEELNPDLREGVLDFKQADMNVTDFETAMEKRYGLHVQVFRKSGEQWMQTSATDHWPLEKHQRVAQEELDFTSSIRK